MDAKLEEENHTENEENLKKLAILKRKYQIMSSENLVEFTFEFEMERLFQLGRRIEDNKIDAKYVSEIKGNENFDLIQFLIQDGYIDENYSNYTSLFYEKSISRSDENFIRSLNKQEAKEYSYTLDNPRLVADRMPLARYNEKGALNFDLLDQLLLTQENAMKLSLILEHLRESENHKFINEFLYISDSPNNFIVAVNNEWSDFFSIMIKSKAYKESQVLSFAILTLIYSEIETLKKVNIGNCLSEYISEKANFLNVDVVYNEKIMEAMKSINVLFTEINNELADDDLLRSIYDESLYKLSIQNINFMLLNYYSLYVGEEIQNRNYSIIQSRPDETLAQYVEENINVYIYDYIDKSDNGIFDDESDVLKLLNNPEITEKLKNQYILKSKTRIKNLRNIRDLNLWESVINGKLATYSEENILEYFFGVSNELDEALIDFINGENKELDFSKIFKEREEWDHGIFFDAAIEVNKLANDKYKQIFDTINLITNLSDHKWEIEKLEISKLNILIDVRTVPINEDNLSFIRNQYPESIEYFINSNPSKYIEEILKSSTFDYEEMIYVLTLDIADELKIKLIDITDKEIPTVNKNYSDNVKIHIFESNFFEDELSDLVESYTIESDKVKEGICDVVEKYQSEIIERRIPIPVELFDRILESEYFSVENKNQFLILILPNLNVNQAEFYLKKLGLNKFITSFYNKRPTIEINETKEEILKIFENKKWIKSYKKDGKNPNLYRENEKKIKDKTSI